MRNRLRLIHRRDSGAVATSPAEALTRTWASRWMWRAAAFAFLGALVLPASFVASVGNLVVSFVCLGYALRHRREAEAVGRVTRIKEADGLAAGAVGWGMGR